jgi:hydroxymethylpyrimidine/phosphomethylpyrimidine kinase
VTATPRTALTIAGSDSGGGAGIQADLRTFFACGVHGLVSLTAVTVQNSLGVQGFTEIPADVVVAQIKAVAGDMGVNAAKTGMLATAEIIQAVAKTLDEVHIGRDTSVPFVVDPVAAAMTGQADKESQYAAVRALLEFGSSWALVKGGHMYDDPHCVDLLSDGREFIELSGHRYDTENTHGGGDTMASAITAALAKGATVPDAVAEGKRFIERCVAEGYALGAGVGPVSPFWRLKDS